MQQSLSKVSKHQSPLPNFMIMVHWSAIKLNPDDAKLKEQTHNFQNAFRDMWNALALRDEVSKLNEGEFAAQHDRYEPNPKTLRRSDANVGTAIVELYCDGQEEVSRDRLVAFSRNFIKRVGGVELPDQWAPVVLPEGWVPVAENPMYEGLGREACTEHRLINELARRYPRKSVNGSLGIYTERVPCPSCQKVMTCFKADHPNLKITLTYTYEGDAEAEHIAIENLSSAGIKVQSVRTTSL